jgi:hypothetical protein
MLSPVGFCFHIPTAGLVLSLLPESLTSLCIQSGPCLLWCLVVGEDQRVVDGHLRKASVVLLTGVSDVVRQRPSAHLPPKHYWLLELAVCSCMF